jgi:hypothetical protein
MIAAEIIGQVLAAGGQIAVDGSDLVLSATGPLPGDLLDKLKAYKTAILAVLATPTVTEEAEDLREAFEERAAMLEHDVGLSRPQAEQEAARLTATLARNRDYLWASLRSALLDYPELLAALPDKPGPVDALPLGVAKVAVLKARRGA